MPTVCCSTCVSTTAGPRRAGFSSTRFFSPATVGVIAPGGGRLGNSADHGEKCEIGARHSVVPGS